MAETQTAPETTHVVTEYSGQAWSYNGKRIGLDTELTKAEADAIAVAMEDDEISSKRQLKIAAKPAEKAATKKK